MKEPLKLASKLEKWISLLYFEKDNCGFSTLNEHNLQFFVLGNSYQYLTKILVTLNIYQYETVLATKKLF